MTTTNFSKYSIQVLTLINKWAKVLKAEDVIIHRDGTITLICKDGCICDHEKPTVAELKYAARRYDKGELPGWYLNEFSSMEFSEHFTF